ncbi:stromelysin-3-like [Engraulis encrasicolus]|uniref:stromelysin-3-like n=1 Tax=Engraulis encrasicolus TaxID=184585 RepID=UPI002FD063EC
MWFSRGLFYSSLTLNVFLCLNSLPVVEKERADKSQTLESLWPGVSLRKSRQEDAAPWRGDAAVQESLKTPVSNSDTRRRDVGLQERHPQDTLSSNPQRRDQDTSHHRRDEVSQDTAPQRRDEVLQDTGAQRRDVSRRPRCGVPDYPAQRGPLASRRPDTAPQRRREVAQAGRRLKRYVLFGGRWEKNDLTYKIVRFPWQMEPAKVRRVFLDALRVWSDVTPLTFTEVTTAEADIVIDFDRYWHGDNLPFDGPGGILAHAFFPRTHRAGDIHFDYDEAWTVGNDMGTDLLHVAVHEFGHVLGLQHSLEPGAVMSPFYNFSYPLELSPDDIQGIQYLYGPRPYVPPPPHPGSVETNELPPHKPDACHSDFDAVSVIRGELFFFKDGWTWRIRDDRLHDGYPALASRHWRGIPERIDATFEDKAGNIWFFQDHLYWVFDAEQQIKGPDWLQSLGLHDTRVEAALRWREGAGHHIYFFSAGSYWLFDPTQSHIDPAFPRLVRQDWHGIPEHIDAAFQDQYGYAVFISGRHYWKLDPVGRRLLPGYPRLVSTDFFGCHGGT